MGLVWVLLDRLVDTPIHRIVGDQLAPMGQCIARVFIAQRHRKPGAVAKHRVLAEQIDTLVRIQMVPEFAHPRRVGRGVQLAVNEPLHPIRPLTVPAGMRTTMRWRRPSPIAAADTRSASSIT